MEQPQKAKEKGTFHDVLRQTADEFVHRIYALTRQFPQEEAFGVTSQLRRAALSVVLNYVEGFARNRDRVYKNFLEIAFGSLQETKYLLSFAEREKYISKQEYDALVPMGNKISAMLWGIIKKLPAS